MNLLQELNETARVCVKPEVRRQLKSAALSLRDALKKLAADPTKDNLAAVNGAWAHGIRVLEAAPPLGGDGTAGGAMPVPKYEEMRKAA